MKKLIILQETKHWLAINKPAGLIVERSPFEHPTIESLVWEYLSGQLKKPYLGIVHRLDRVTSGVLLLAKKKQALKLLNEQFRLKQIQKTYLALTEREPPAKQGKLIHWLETDQKNKRALIHTKDGRNRALVELNYEVVEKQEQAYLLKINPLSGKFHQIRAQLAAINCPIIGDEKYGSSIEYPDRTIALHAWQLDFHDPLSKGLIQLSAPPPF